MPPIQKIEKGYIGFVNNPDHIRHGEICGVTDLVQFGKARVMFLDGQSRMVDLDWLADRSPIPGGVGLPRLS